VHGRKSLGWFVEDAISFSEKKPQFQKKVAPELGVIGSLELFDGLIEVVLYLTEVARGHEQPRVLQANIRHHTVFRVRPMGRRLKFKSGLIFTFTFPIRGRFASLPVKFSVSPMLGLAGASFQAIVRSLQICFVCSYFVAAVAWEPA